MTLTVSSRRSEAPRWRRWAQAGAFAGLLVLALGAPARAATAIGARGWDHGDYGRLVFDLGPGVSGQASLEGDTLVITFSEAVTVDPKAALGKLARFAGTAQLSDDGRTLRVALKLPVTFKPQNYQGKLVVDLRPAAAKPAQPPAKPPAAKPPAEPVPAKPLAEPVPAAPAPPHQQPAVAAPPPTPVAAMPAPAVAPPVAPPGPVAAATPAPAASAVGEATMQVRAALGGVEVEAAFSAATGAVAFARGDAVWVVFDRPGFDAAALMDTPLATLGRIEPLDLAGASGFRLVGRQLPPEVTADGNRWRLVFGPDARPPATPLVVGIATDSHGNRQLAIKVAGARAALGLLDPDIGDVITVVPVTRGGAGILAAARLPDLSLLASTQGIAFLALSDGLETQVDANAVVITGPQGGLTLSGTPPAVPGHGRGPAQAGLDVGTWAVPGNVGEVRAQLAHEVSTADPANRQLARLRFARYLVAQGLGAEAIGLAKLIMQDDPALADDLGFRQMRGIAQAMQERPAEALTDLGLPALEFSPDAVLWRGYALAAQGQAVQAHRVFAGMAAIDHYPAHIATRLLAAMAETALAADDLAGAAEFSRALGEHAATAATRAQAQALAGRVALRNADVAAARDYFEAALASGERIARVDAELGLIELGLADGTMTRPQAIERLDRLRYAWRGDAKELAVLRRLADLQLAEGRWRDGLETLRVAMKLFPDDPGRDTLAETQAAAFRRLFLSGAADALPPVQAVALYFDYRDLTPLGAEGDEMIRRLADRLIQVELLDQAKTLLTHQVTYRLQGIAQAQVAANLALLHLTDHEAAKALAVLDRTEQPTLPEATARLRRLLRAGALADLGRGAEARALLAGDTSEDAARLGAEIAWNARDWAGAAENLGRLLAGVTPPASGAPAAAAERLALRLAIAAALAKDVERLKALALAWGPAMAQGKSAEAFAMLTGATDPSAIATRNLAQTMANAGADTGFMDLLRQRMAAGQLNAIN